MAHHARLHHDRAARSNDSDSERAARRPRPNRDPPVPVFLRPKLPIWPAFFAALITSPTKVLGRLVAAMGRGCVLAGPGSLPRGGSSREDRLYRATDGGRSVEIVHVSG